MRFYSYFRASYPILVQPISAGGDSQRRQGEVCLDLPAEACFAYISCGAQTAGAVRLEVTVDSPNATQLEPWVQHVTYRHATLQTLSFPVALPAQARRLRVYAVRCGGNFDYADVSVTFLAVPAGMRLATTHISAAELKAEGQADGDATSEDAAGPLHDELTIAVSRPGWLHLNARRRVEPGGAEVLKLFFLHKGEAASHGHEINLNVDVTEQPSAFSVYCKPGRLSDHHFFPEKIS